MPKGRIRQPHRDKYEIIKQILQTVSSRQNGVNSSFEIAFRCELTLHQFIRYRDLLLKKKLLLISSDKGLTHHYEITEKGIRYLKVSTEIENDLKPVTS